MGALQTSRESYQNLAIMLPLKLPKHVIGGSPGSRSRFSGCPKPDLVDKDAEKNVMKFNSREKSISLNSTDIFSATLVKAELEKTPSLIFHVAEKKFRRRVIVIKQLQIKKRMSV